MLAEIVEQWRRRQDMQRARMRLILQAQAICRRFCDGDKGEGQKLWAAIQADPDHAQRSWLEPFLAAMVPLDDASAALEKLLARRARALPVYPWAKEVRGLGDVSLAGIVAESSIGPGEYRSPSALWKRFGLAVIEGGRQRRISGDAALVHGYAPERRALMWNVGNCLIKSQLRSEKGEDGKKLPGSEYALGELGQVYLDRKAFLIARDVEAGASWTPAHIHNDAKRYMEKRLLRQLWQEWRRATIAVQPMNQAPAASLPSAILGETLGKLSTAV